MMEGCQKRDIENVIHFALRAVIYRIDRCNDDLSPSASGALVLFRGCKFNFHEYGEVTSNLGISVVGLSLSLFFRAFAFELKFVDFVVQQIFANERHCQAE